MTHWFRVYGHGSGLSPHVPDFVVDDELVFPTASTGPRREPTRAEPWFSIVDARVYPTPQHPDGTSDRPWFEVVGSFVYPAAGHPEGPRSAPSYQVRRPAP